MAMGFIVDLKCILKKVSDQKVCFWISFETKVRYYWTPKANGPLPWWNTWACQWLRRRWRSPSRPHPSSSCAGPGLPPWLTLWWRYLQGGTKHSCSNCFHTWQTASCEVHKHKSHTGGCGFLKVAACRGLSRPLKQVKATIFALLHYLIEDITNEFWKLKFVLWPYKNNQYFHPPTSGSWWQWFLEYWYDYCKRKHTGFSRNLSPYIRICVSWEILTWRNDELRLRVPGIS